MVRTGIIILGIIVVLVVIGMGTGVINLQSLTIGQPAGNGGIQTSPDGIPSTGLGFTGQLTVNVEHRDALDNSEIRVEGSDLRTTYYKSSDGVTFSTIGSGTGVTLTIDTAQDSILYFTSVVLDPFFVAPSSTADPNLNPRIIDFGFMDVNNDGTREWWFKVDLRDTPTPVAGQTASTLSLFINSYNDGASTLNAPANIPNVGSNSGAVTFIRWEQTVLQETVDPVYEYTIQIVKVTGVGGTEFYDVGQSTLDIPNIGLVSLGDFDEQILSSTDVLYRWKVGITATLDNANYVTTAQNGNEVHPIPFKIVTNLSDNAFNDNLDVTLTLKSLTSSQGTVTVSDTVRLDES
jgi:hypothetical protein